MGLTDEQWQQRRSFLGGTDMAALAGLSPWAGPIDVWRDKVEERPPQAGSTMMSLGTLLEPVVAGLFTEATGLHARRQEKPVRDRHRPWLGGHLDRWVWAAGASTEGGILECKWAMSRDGWGASSTLESLREEPQRLLTEEVPPHYAVQVQHYLGVTGRQRGYLAALLGYADFRWYAIPRDDEVIEMLRDLGHRFWHENVLPGVPPEPDGSESYGRYLVQKYRTSRGEEAVATPAQQEWALRLRQATADRLEAEGREAEERQRLQASMGEVAKLVLPFGSITWRSHEVHSVAWQAVAAALASDHNASLAPYVEAHSTTTQQRPFRPALTEEESDA